MIALKTRLTQGAGKVAFIEMVIQKGCPTVCVTCVWAGVDSAWEQEKLEARKMLEYGAESHTSGSRIVRRQFIPHHNYR